MGKTHFKDKLFGTDGIRGEANIYPVTCEIALKTGQAVGRFAKESGYQKVIIGKDTRISGDMLESALAAGVMSMGTDVLLTGVIPTPAVAYFCSIYKDAGAGIVISASHNPYQDNGIKIFKQGGEKLLDDQENTIENYILNPQDVSRKEIGRILSIPDSLEKYSDFLLGVFPFKKLIPKLNLVIDCSNGAASKIGHMVFNDQLFNVQFINDSPDGKNINKDCGSQHTRQLREMVKKKGADIGLAFDGDADRLIAVDETGRQITGDTILAVCAKFAKEKNKLVNNTIVSTIMSNVGLTKALDSLGIKHIMSDVGDRRVLEDMKKSQAVIGGEDSGHMIFLDHHTTGDGMLSALKLLEVMAVKQQPLSLLADIMTVYPQVLMNVKVKNLGQDFMKIQSVADTINSIENKLEKNGRVLIRYSGTQPLLRVMVEGPDQDLVEQYCQKICDIIKKNI